MDAATNEKEADHGAGARVLDHLVNANFVRASAALEEEVVEEIELEIAAGKNIGAGPGVAHGIDR